MGFNDWIYIEPAPMNGVDRFEDVDAEAKRTLASAIEQRIKTRVDPGVDLNAAQRAQSITARQEDGQIVIDEDDRAGVLRGSPSVSKPSSRTDLDDLFQMSSGVPTVGQDAAGNRKLIFRAVDESKLFNLGTSEQDETVEVAVTDALRMGIVDAFEGAVTTVNRRSIDR